MATQAPSLLTLTVDEAAERVVLAVSVLDGREPAALTWQEAQALAAELTTLANRLKQKVQVKRLREQKEAAALELAALRAKVKGEG